MNTRLLLGMAVMGLFTASPLLLATGCSDDEPAPAPVGPSTGALCSDEGAYSCSGAMLQRCTNGTVTDVEDCGSADDCHADAGHCHDEHHDHGHDDHHDHGHDDHHGHDGM